MTMTKMIFFAQIPNVFHVIQFVNFSNVAKVLEIFNLETHLNLFACIIVRVAVMLGHLV